MLLFYRFNRLMLIHCQSSSQFLLALQSFESLLSRRSSNVRLVIIDSIDGFLDRDKFSNTQSYFSSSIRTLAHFIHTRQLVVIATRSCCSDRQIRRSIKRDSDGKIKIDIKTLQNSIDSGDGGYFKEWQHLITTRRLFTKHSTNSDVFSIVDLNNGSKTHFMIINNGITFCNDPLA